MTLGMLCKHQTHHTEQASRRGAVWSTDLATCWRVVSKPRWARTKACQVMGGAASIAQEHEASLRKPVNQHSHQLSGQVRVRPEDTRCRRCSDWFNGSGRYKAARTGKAHRRPVKGNFSEIAGTIQRCPTVGIPPTASAITRRKVDSAKATEELIETGLAADGTESMRNSFPTLFPSSVIKVGRSLPIPPAFAQSIRKALRFSGAEHAKSLSPALLNSLLETL